MIWGTKEFSIISVLLTTILCIQNSKELENALKIIKSGFFIFQIRKQKFEDVNELFKSHTESQVY